ncbi:hypothetical protein DFH06DRAFT_516006 [Mycena polygramma]|nr:hypothetical protein DFH06DRAFT_516006 [Mycena polygramma]
MPHTPPAQPVPPIPCLDFDITDIYDTDSEDLPVVESAEEREAREIRRRRNELAPIARLPPEILADIFVRCVPTTINTLYTDFSWLNATRVTSRWRTIALECPDFWSTLLFSRPKWTPVMLARSKKASLAIRVDLKKELANSPEPILIENASRLGTLDIRSPQTLLQTFMDNLEHVDAAPRLQYIRVVNTDAHALGQGGMWLPQDLFRRREVVESRKSGAHLGVRLHLDGCAFSWDSGWYFYLTHLDLENITQTQRPTMEVLLTILLGSPNLQVLKLIHCSPTTRVGFPVSLPHLTALTIKSDVPGMCERLMGFLSIPPSASFCAWFGIKDNLWPALYSSLIPEFTDVSADRYNTVRIIHDRGVTYSLAHSATPEWSRTLRIDAANWQPNLAQPTHILRVTDTIRERLNWRNVTHLHLGGTLGTLGTPTSTTPDHGAYALWDAMGRGMPRVSTVHLHKTFPGVCVEFLLTQAMLLVGVSHHKSCFGLRTAPHGLAFRPLTHAWPALRRLALHKMDLGHMPNEGAPSRADVVRALLWARREGRRPVWQLEIEECENVYTEDLVNFRLFADVVYDGKGEKVVFKAEDPDESLRSFSINVFAEMIEHREKKAELEV